MKKSAIEKKTETPGLRLNLPATSTNSAKTVNDMDKIEKISENWRTFPFNTKYEISDMDYFGTIFVAVITFVLGYVLGRIKKQEQAYDDGYFKGHFDALYEEQKRKEE